MRRRIALGVGAKLECELRRVPGLVFVFAVAAFMLVPLAAAQQIVSPPQTAPTPLQLPPSQPPSPGAGVNEGGTKQTAPENSPQSADQDKRGTESSPLAIKLLNTGKSEPEAAEEAQRIKERTARERWATNWTIGLTAALVFAAFLQVSGLVGQIIVYRKQAGIMQKALSATTKAADAARDGADALPAVERAYIFLSEERVPVEITRPGGSILYTPEEATEYFMTAVTRFQNHGKTPAIVTHIAQSIKYFEAKPREFPDEMAPIPAGFVIGAGRISDPWPVAKANSRIEWNEAKGGAAYILLTGRIFYKTIFGGAGETGFCFEYNWERESFVMSPNDKLNYYR